MYTGAGNQVLKNTACVPVSEVAQGKDACVSTTTDFVEVPVEPTQPPVEPGEPDTGDNGGLASTGASIVMLTAGVAGIAVLLLGAAFLLMWRRSSEEDSEDVATLS